MKLIELTLDTPEQNVAFDEMLLERAEAEPHEDREALRIWESPSEVVVIGRSSKIGVEAQVERCRAEGVPVLRRASGGAAIVAGPGCLMYAVVLDVQRRPELGQISAVHEFVLTRVAAAVARSVPGVLIRGTSDLALGDVKFSGNSMRFRRTHVLYHGTLLYNFPLERVSVLLGTPPRQPEYRRGREHRAFIGNLPTTREALREGLIAEWQAEEPLEDWPRAALDQLVAEKYSDPAWNERY